ncbi:MAG: hypothetical protein WBD22_02260 [Pyrinomonadaceae bacterium]
MENQFANAEQQRSTEFETGVDNNPSTLPTLKDKVSNNISNAAGKLNESSDKVQGVLEVKADQFGKYAHSTIEKVNHFGHRTAEALEATSDYVKNFDLYQTKEQIRQRISQRPGWSIGAAAAVGVILGLLVGKRRKTGK